MTVETAIAGAGISAIGTLLSGSQAAENQSASAAQARYQQEVSKNAAKVSKYNGRFAEQDAARINARGQTLAQMQDQKTAQVLGEQLAEQGASGIDVGRGSSTLVRASTHMVGRQDTQMIRENANIDSFNAMIRKYNIDAQGNAQQAQADLYGMAADNYESAADNTMLATWINTGASILGSSSSIADKWKLVQPGAAV